ncbi:MAG: hypothetical protein ACRC1Z_10305 [Waterburya sp.]
MGLSKKRSQYRSGSSQKHELRIPVFTPLNAEEEKLRESYEQQVKTAFYSAGTALSQLQQLRLYRNTHTSFEEFCLDVFSFSRDYAYLMMRAAKVYQNLADHLPTIGRQLPLPTRQRQLRPIIKAQLDETAQVEVWVDAIGEAEGKVPSSSIVASAVRQFLVREKKITNPFTTGEVARIVVRDNHKLKGKGNCWCIIDQVLDTSCTVNTWSENLEIPVENLVSLEFDPEQYRQIEDLGVRMTKLHETGSLDAAALWVLKGLASLERPVLTPLEEKLLAVLEEVYLFHDVE